MEKTFLVKWWWMAAIAIAILVFLLNFPGMGGVRPARAQAAGVPALASGFSWEYQLDFKAASLPGAQGQVASLIPALEGQGVASELQPLGDSMYRLSLTSNQGMEQVRQVIYSTQMAGFIGGAAEVQVSMPVGSLLDTPFKLDSNLTTGYSWQVIPSRSANFVQVGETTYAARSRGYGLPSVQTLVLRPETAGTEVVDLVYRRPFEPDEAITRHLRITLGAQALGIDLTDPHPEIINAAVGPAALPSAKNPIAEIPVKGVLPASWDWRTAGIVPAPRDQAACGACWAFGTVGVMESAIAKAGGPMTDLSEQFLVSCNTSGWNCTGGLTAHMWHYDTLAINQSAIGAVLEADKPYTATNGTCSVAYNHPYRLSGWQFITPDEFSMPTVDEIKNAIYTYGPITAGVCADSGWDYYTGGIYNPSSNACIINATPGTNHQIILVGWDDATSSWILRNSWGPSWGESGYMRISWDTTGTTSRVGEGTSWVTWAAPGPAPFGKSSPANASIGQPGNPVLSWGASSGADSYTYCVDTSNNNTCDTSWISIGASTSAALSGLADGPHYWQVRATNASGTTEANAGTWWSFSVGQAHRVYLPMTIKPALPPAGFNKTAPANGATNQPTGPTLSWSASSGATSYDYCIDIYNDNACNGTWTSTGTGTTAALAGLPLSTTFYWQVRAVNAAGSTFADGGTWWSFTTTSSLTDWTTIVSEDFEGSFPSAWQIIDNAGGYTWGKRNCRPFTGSYSGWVVGGGASGSSLGCGSYYPNNVDTMMIYGPFSLADATSADLSYQLWLNSELNYDGVCYYASIDNINFYGNCITGNSSGWISRVLDLGNVYTLGNLMGQPDVWIALYFHSDSTINKTEGAHVDNIVLRKCTSGTCSGSPAVPNSANGLMVETPSHKMIP